MAATGSVFVMVGLTGCRSDALDTLVAWSRSAVEDIDALAAPDSMQADADAMLAEYRSANDETEARG